ncbi:MAG: hypothetical protein ACI93R_003715 [Flavobacteriales bacterium]|jgi:hypothetical protein
MNIETLQKLSKEYTDKGLYRGNFESLSVTTYRQIDYANNVLLVESEEDAEDEVLMIYAIHEEATRCLYWPMESVSKYVGAIKLSDFPVKDFLALYKTHFRGSKIFNHIDTGKIDTIYSFSSPAYDDWCGELFIKTGEKKYALMWDYCD